MSDRASDYEAFLRRKFAFQHDYGFEVDEADLSPCLLPHQRDIVRWALRGGRRALFEAFGLGKGVQQLEILRLIHRREGGRGLIVCPLGVRQEFTRDARDLLELELRFVRHSDEVASDGLYLTNYESIRDGRLDPDLFDAVSLDEASVLRSFGSKTYQTFLGLFQATRYRFVATATPSPNRYKELIHYAGFLGVMDTGQALTRFFQRDSTKANHLTLYPHKEGEFFAWLHSWAIFLQRPSDLGYSDEGYDMPELDVVWHELPNQPGEGGHDRDGQGLIFRDAALGVSAAAREKRDTLAARVAKAKEIVDASPGDHFILWHDLETERAASSGSATASIACWPPSRRSPGPAATSSATATERSSSASASSSMTSSRRSIGATATSRGTPSASTSSTPNQSVRWSRRCAGSGRSTRSSPTRCRTSSASTASTRR